MHLLPAWPNLRLLPLRPGLGNLTACLNLGCLYLSPPPQLSLCDSPPQQVHQTKLPVVPDCLTYWLQQAHHDLGPRLGHL